MQIIVIECAHLNFHVRVASLKYAKTDKCLDKSIRIMPLKTYTVVGEYVVNKGRKL